MEQAPFEKPIGPQQVYIPRIPWNPTFITVFVTRITGTYPEPDKVSPFPPTAFMGNLF
jgi:hypothetical protein